MSVITVRVRPNSGRSEVVVDGEKIIVFVKASPESGRANAEVLKLIQKYFRKAPSIVKGKTSRVKVLRLE